MSPETSTIVDAIKRLEEKCLKYEVSYLELRNERAPLKKELDELRTAHAACPRQFAVPWAGWVDLKTVSYRAENNVLLLAHEVAGGKWASFGFGARISTLNDRGTRDEAKAALDRALIAANERHAEQSQFVAVDDHGGPAVMEGTEIIDRPKDFETAQRIAAALNAYKPPEKAVPGA